MNYHEWQHEQWREHQRRSLDITDEQLDCLLEVASAAAAIGGGAGYSELVTGIMMMSMSASEIATIAGAVAAVETKERQMQKPVEMWNDERPIRSITTQGEGYSHWCVGRTGVTRIVAYRENGQCAGVPWLAVYEGDWLAHRVNAAAVESVWYGKVPKDNKGDE